MESWQKLGVIDFGKLHKPGMFKVQVTPDLARQMIERNTGNRRIRKTLVTYLVKQIVNGEWQSEHPQPVVFSDAGRLIDGQHRLLAIIEANRPCVVTVRTGCPDGIREYLDTGIVRTLDDRVTFVDDVSLNKILSQVITAWWFAFENPGYVGSGKPSPEQARRCLSEHEGGMVWASKVVMQKKQRAVARIPVAVAAVQMWERDQQKAGEFYPMLFSQDGEIQQARILRDWLLRNAAKVGGGHFGGQEVYCRSVYCMDAFLIGKRVVSVRKGDWSK